MEGRRLVGLADHRLEQLGDRAHARDVERAARAYEVQLALDRREAHVDLDEVNARIAAGEFAPENLLFQKAALAPVESEVVRDPADPDTWGKVGRNEPCPCGSGKKYKHCHGTLG